MSSLTVPADSDRQRHAWATPYLVMGTRGRLRLILVVQRCAFECGRAHVHSGKADFVSGRRKAGCGAGTYVVHAALSWQEPAA